MVYKIFTLIPLRVRITLAAGLVLAYPSYPRADNIFTGLSYVTIEGPNGYKLLTGFPESISMAVSGSDIDKSNVSYSVLNTLAIAGGSYIKFAKTIQDNFIVLIFSEAAMTESGINMTELKGFENDPPMVAALQDGFNPGMSCVSGTVFSDKGTYLRTLILSKYSITNEELAQCSLEAAAHIFGIYTGNAGYQRAEYPEQISRFSKMIWIKKTCLDKRNLMATCGDAALEAVRSSFD